MQKTEAKPCPGTGEYQPLGQGASQYSIKTYITLLQIIEKINCFYLALVKEIIWKLL